MPFDAKVYKVLIASPSDVGDERKIVPEVINEWNTVSTLKTGSILMPVKWETHSAPLLGGRPQGIINDQLVKDCDLLVGLFWTRIGTHTGSAISGTVEEIQEFVQQEKPVMLYFSQSPVSPESIEINQFSKLKKFKEDMRLRGLTEEYSSLDDFRQKFTRQLAINLDNLFINIARGYKNKRKIEREIAEDINLTREEIRNYLVIAIERTSRDGEWADLAPLGKYLKTYTPVNYSILGFRTLKSMIKKDPYFEVKMDRKSSSAQADDVSYVRVKGV